MRIVLDTNAVLDLLHWHNAELDPVARALAEGRARLLCDAACLRELRTVLRYPKFGLDEAAGAALYAAYLALIEELPLPEQPDPTLPRCRDREDQKFFDLAVRGAAALLVSRDRAVLRLGRHRLCPPTLKVIAPPALATLLN
ncbi:MAG: putative toxin-antitoxin system toxin component, PIN family [Methyloversatilis sp.]|nr:putative toxin-antitoxin system toxin component, PIN family [Methyloversatilis sp.]